METINALGDSVFETRTVAGREYWIVQAAYTKGMLFYTRPARLKEGEIAGVLMYLAECRRELDDMALTATDAVWFNCRADESDDEDAPEEPAAEPASTVLEPANSLTRTASWVIREKATQSVVLETFDSRVVACLNTAKYEAVPILAYLQEFGAALRHQAC